MRDDTRLVKWVDKDSKNLKTFLDTIPDSPEVLVGIKFDCILVAILSEDGFKQIQNDICSRGIDKGVVRWRMPQPL